MTRDELLPYVNSLEEAVRRHGYTSCRWLILTTAATDWAADAITFEQALTRCARSHRVTSKRITKV